MLNMAKVKCSECGIENDSSSKFCQKCGTELKSYSNTNENPKKGILGWWGKQGKNNRILTGVGGCCAGIIFFVLILSFLFPVTSLSIEPSVIQIDNQTTEYTIHGKTEPNATVKITSSTLNLTEQPVKVDTNGNFSYTGSIPINVTETDLNITAKSPNKSQNEEKINIQRPLTPLTMNPVNISSNATTLVIQGKTDPNASITLNSTDINITDVQLIADAQGNFNKSVTIPINLNKAGITAKATASGKRSNIKNIEVNRDQPAPATAPATAPAAATTYTIAKLYSSPPPVGTEIRVTGKVVQSGDGFVRLENNDLKDIWVKVDGTPSVYEDQKATVEGTYTGPYQYDTAMGSTRTVPGIEGEVV